MFNGNILIGMFLSTRQVILYDKASIVTLPSVMTPNIR